MKKTAGIILIAVLLLSMVVIPNSRASAANLKELAYLEYYKFLEDELASMGKVCQDEYFYKMLSPKEYYMPHSQFYWEIDYSRPRKYYNEKIIYVYLQDMTGDGVAELIYSKLIRPEGDDCIDIKWTCIYSFINGKLQRIGQTGDHVQYHQESGSYSYYSPEGYIDSGLQDLYICIGTNGATYICADPADLYKEDVTNYYKYQNGKFRKTDWLNAVYVEWYKSSSLTAHFGYWINDQHASEKQFEQKLKLLQGKKIIKLEPNDYNNAMWECGKVSKHLRTPSEWAVSQVNAAISKNYVPRILQDSYTAPITREEFCEIATRYYETITGKEIESRKKFNDTNNLSVSKMGGMGVVNGVGGGNFAPNKHLTREQAAVILSNLASAMGNPLTTSDPDFSDSSSISSWAVPQVGSIQKAGIMSGVGNGKFAPADKYTREQSIITILRLENIQPYIESLSFSDESFEMYSGSVKKITPVIDSPDTARMHLKWSSSNPKVATVNESSGEISALSGGKTTISVEAEGGASASFELNVIQASGPIWAKLPITVNIYSKDDPKTKNAVIAITEVKEGSLYGCYRITGHIVEESKKYASNTFVHWILEDYYGNVIDRGEESIFVYGKDAGEEISFSIVSIHAESDGKYILKFEK